MYQSRGRVQKVDLDQRPTYFMGESSIKQMLHEDWPINHITRNYIYYHHKKWGDI